MELTDIMREAQQALNGDYEQMVSEKRKGYWFDVGSLSCRCSE